MSEITPTAARVVKKSLWKDISRWIDEKQSEGNFGFEERRRRNWISRFLTTWKKHLGDLYAGAIIVKHPRYFRKHRIIVFNWRVYIESKRLGVVPIGYDIDMNESELPGVVFTEHAIERMAERLETLDRKKILQELVAIAVPACLLIFKFGKISKPGDYFAVKTPHGIGLLVVDDSKEPDELIFLLTWIGLEENLATKYKNIEWRECPLLTRDKGGTLKIDIPANAKLYLAEKQTTDSAQNDIEEDRNQSEK